MSETVAADVKLSNVTVNFGEVTAVDDVSLHIQSGEFFTLLGPSGCGKTTLLRAIAGFYRQSSGQINLGGEVLDDVPAHKRDTGMVFQNYAVFPHLNVWQNIEYGLKPRGVRGKEADERIREALAMVDLTGYEERMPKQLSGGQQQRVVIARAVAIRPRVLLMDEPLANLDAKLRVRLRNDLKKLQGALGITTIYVTHDQEEALSLSDRIAVMSAGKALQVGTPSDIYDKPTTLGVAEFVGEGNFFQGKVLEQAGEGTTIRLSSNTSLLAAGHGSEHSGDVAVGFRPQDASIKAGAHEGFVGTVETTIYLGSYVRFEINCGLGGPIAVQLNAHDVPKGVSEGATVTVTVPARRVMVFPDRDLGGEL